jgi:G:T-mismatch repair DNA endonuclease (very short patch repair protein)
VPDIICNDNIIIEVYGDYWHANPNKYNKNDIIKFPNNKICKVSDLWEKDKNRIEILQDDNHVCLVVWEYDIHHDLDNTIDTITKFINENI